MAVKYHSSFDITRNFSDTTAQLRTAANTVITYTVPGTSSQKFTVLFEYASDSNIYVGYNTTPAVPASGTVVSNSFVEYKPEARFVIGGDVLSFISPDTVAYFGISIRSIPN